MPTFGGFFSLIRYARTLKTTCFDAEKLFTNFVLNFYLKNYLQKKRQKWKCQIKNIDRTCYYNITKSIINTTKYK